jgi:hypothetical protein
MSPQQALAPASLASSQSAEGGALRALTPPAAASIGFYAASSVGAQGRKP